MAGLYEIAITMVAGVGDVNAKKLIKHCGSAEAVFREDARKLKMIPNIGMGIINALKDSSVIHRAEKELNFVRDNNISLLYYKEDGFPERMRNCYDSPVLCYFMGNCNINAKRVLSIVGTRKASKYGIFMCSEIIEALREMDVLIVSGLAYGIDVCSHLSALDKGMNTIGVLGHGLDRIYPSAHHKVAVRMIANGGLITDFPSSTKPDKENFPKRNRIIAALSDGVLVVEAAKSGGALITADIADSYNKEVMAVPGRANDKYSKGCNEIIKSHKATMVENVEDIIECLNWDVKNQKSVQTIIFDELNADEKVVLGLLNRNGESGLDWLFANSKLSFSRLSELILLLEFKGFIRILPGKRYRLANSVKIE